jgi:hypothetical protein
MSSFVVERLVQEEDLANAKSERLELPAELSIGVAIESPAQQRMEMLRAQVDLQRIARVQWEGEVANGAISAAHGTGVADEALDQRLAFSEGQLFLAIGADGQIADPVPRTTRRLTPAARSDRRMA